MTLSEILSDVFARVNYAPVPEAAVTTRITAFVNKWHRVILSKPTLSLLRDSTITLATTNGTATYALPAVTGRINGIHDRTHDTYLTERTLDWLRLADPGLHATGAPATCWIPLGEVHVARQPADASQLFAKSTGLDGQAVTIEGIRADGSLATVTALLTTTTPVTLSAALTDVVEVTKFYLASAAVGTVTLHEDSGVGTELARIPIGRAYARYPQIQLYPTPAGETYSLDITRQILDLTAMSDEPLLPPDFHWLLSSGAEADELRKRDDNRYTVVLAEVEQGIRDLVSWVVNRPQYVLVPGKSRPRHSSLGSQFPAGS